MNNWGQGQLRLFDQLAQICDAVGEAKALAIAPTPTNPDRHGLFTLELEGLRARAAWADELEGMTGRLQAALEDSNARLRVLLEEARDPSQSTEKVEQGVTSSADAPIRDDDDQRSNQEVDNRPGDERRTISSRPDNPTIINENAQSDRPLHSTAKELAGENAGSPMMRTLETKYLSLSANHKELKEARDILEARLRKKIKGERAWMEYAKELEMRLAQTDATKQRIQDSHQAAVENVAPSSSSTQGDEELPVTRPSVATFEAEEHTVHIKNEPLSDEPVVVSSKMIRKRNAIGTATPVASSSRTHVKTEHASPTSPSGMARLSLLAHNDSIDLDDLGRHFTTPKKNRLLHTAAEARTEASTTRKLSNQATRTIVSTATPSRSTAEHNPTALQPRSPNKIVLPRTSNVVSSKKRRRIDEDAIRELGGDTENHLSERAVKAQPYTPLQRYNLKRRLGGLLDIPTVPKSPLAIDKHDLSCKGSSPITTPLDERETGKHRGQSALLGANVDPNTPASALPRSSTVRRRKTSMQDMTTMSVDDDPDQEPCRARPVHRLGLQDFKLNPKHGGGQAYSDVVRGKEQRKCLPGCIRPECCGPVFREMAVMGRESAPRSAAQKDLDQKLLKEYLGRDIGRLTAASKEEREELLLQARTKELSKKYGKHRHSFERARSPPNFWDTGFPSTQEEQDIRARVREVERQLVQKRYDEAMRGNEQWIFRDE